MKTYCTKQHALNTIEDMSDKELNALINKCPARVQLLVKARMVNWREVLSDWYMVISF